MALERSQTRKRPYRLRPNERGEVGPILYSLAESMRENVFLASADTTLRGSLVARLSVEGPETFSDLFSRDPRFAVADSFTRASGLLPLAVPPSVVNQSHTVSRATPNPPRVRGELRSPRPCAVLVSACVGSACSHHTIRQPLLAPGLCIGHTAHSGVRGIFAERELSTVILPVTLRIVR